MKCITNINQIKVGILIKEKDAVVEVAHMNKTGVKSIPIISSNIINSDIILTNFQELIDLGNHEMYIIGPKEKFPEYYL